MVETVVPIEVLSDLITPPAPRADVPTAPAAGHACSPDRNAPGGKGGPAAAGRARQPTVTQLPSRRDRPPTGRRPHRCAPVAAEAVAPAAPARVELPSTDADYLNNPRPAYPPLSKRMGEQGKVVVRVLIGADGLPQKADIRTSSGFERLDQAALATVMKWRYVPGKRAGVPEAMWFNVPINFVLE
jgi:protein TonB